LVNASDILELFFRLFSDADMEVTHIICWVGLRIKRLAQLVDATASANLMVYEISIGQRFTQKLETMSPRANDEVFHATGTSPNVESSEEAVS
jgi:hypothetical protein